MKVQEFIDTVKGINYGQSQTFLLSYSSAIKITRAGVYKWEFLSASINTHFADIKPNREQRTVDLIRNGLCIGSIDYRHIERMEVL